MTTRTNPICDENTVMVWGWATSCTYLFIVQTSFDIWITFNSRVIRLHHLWRYLDSEHIVGRVSRGISAWLAVNSSQPQS